MNIFRSLKIKKERKELRNAFLDLLNLIIVIDDPINKDLHNFKNSKDTTLSYASSYKKLLNKCNIFKEKKSKDIKFSVLYSLYYALSCYYNQQYSDALENIKESLDLTTKIDNEFQLESRYLHYVATILLSQIVGQEIYEALENKRSSELKLKEEIQEKIENADKLLSSFNSDKYKSLGEEKIKESKLRVLQNQHKLLMDLYSIEIELNSTSIADEFVEILNSLEENLDFIENEMLINDFIVKETKNDTEIIYPSGHVPDVIYSYLCSQRSKLLFYQRNYHKLNELLISFFNTSHYSNWEQPLLLLKNGNREDVIAKMQPFNKLTTYNEYMDNLVFEKNVMKNNVVLRVRSREDQEDIQYSIVVNNENDENENWS